MELLTSLDQPLQGHVLAGVRTLFAPREKAVIYSNSQKPAALQHFFAGSFHEMYNCTKHHTGSAVPRVTKNRAARPHLPSTGENQLRRRRQLLTIAPWNSGLPSTEKQLTDQKNVRHLQQWNLSNTTTSPPYVRQGSQSLVVSTTWNTLSSGVANPKEKEGRPEWALLSKGIVTKLTKMPRPVSNRIMTMWNL